MKSFILFLTILFLFSCKSQITTQAPNITESKSKQDSLQLTFDTWYFKDYEKDSIIGISLNKAYNEIIKNNKGKEIIVALLDTEVDIKHEELNHAIWKNINEVPNNGKDDDNNGYVDDIHGWNYLGDLKGNNIIYAKYSYVRFLKDHESLFENKTVKDVGSDSIRFKLYQKALKYHDNSKKSLKEDLEYYEDMKKRFLSTQKSVRELFKRDSISEFDLDSIYQKAKREKQDSLRKIYYYQYDFKKNNLGVSWINQLIIDTKEAQIKSNNLDYDDRTTIQDDDKNLNIRNGNNIVNANIDKLSHGTYIAGIIGANRQNGKGIAGITDNVKFMILPILGKVGGETDKDLANAIRYAVDNGARIINLSANRHFISNQKLVEDAMKYAEMNNVLFIKGSGNSGRNMDINIGYPNSKYQNTELNNFLLISASNKKNSKYLKPDWVNYGKNTVDLFAPGISIKTTNVNNTYIYEDGSSYANAIVTGVAALIMSYYPDLTAKEVRSILIDSSLKFETDILTNEDPEKYTKFSDLSKYGGVVNAYNAIVMAEKLSKEKN